jgi:hypothetical protein
MKKILIIHPDDRSTDFLKPIYENLPNITVITGGVSYMNIRQSIIEHDQVMMMGHGSPWGLFSMGKFPNSGGYIIDSMMIDLLSEKNNNVYIWCNADLFVDKYKLNGIYSGMFISEVIEAEYCGLPDTEQIVVDESNNTFADILGKQLLTETSLERVYDNTNQTYRELAQSNKVAKYNQNRFYYALD